jgi:hypothetical protein
MHKNVEIVIRYILDKLWQQEKDNRTVKLDVFDFYPDKRFTVECMESYKNDGWGHGTDKLKEILPPILSKLQNEFKIISGFSVLRCNDDGKPVVYVVTALESIDGFIQNEDAANQPKQKDPTPKEDPRIINTLYKIICGITKKHYTNKTNRISQIQTTILNESGIDINEKTLRSHIERALEEDQDKES